MSQEKRKKKELIEMKKAPPSRILKTPENEAPKKTSSKGEDK